MISIIAAKSSNGIIGANGKIPWYISNDFKHFRDITTGHTIVMGLNTYMSLPGSKALRNRRNIVLSTRDIYLKDATVIHNIEELFNIVSDDEEVFIIGGGSLYKQFIDIANRLYITEIDKAFDGDTYFPNINSNDWIVTHKTLCDDLSVDFKYTFVIYDKIYH